MFNISNYSNAQEVHINAVSGTLVKNYKNSFIIRFHLKSDYAKWIFSEEPRLEFSRFNGTVKKPIVVLQVMVCGDMEVLVEIMWKEDFDALFEEEK